MNTTLTTARPHPMRLVVAIAILCASVISVLGVAPKQADAWAWNPTVNLKGRAIACSSSATWVWIEGGNGERGWATQPGGNYHFRFNRVPSSGMNVTVKFGNRVCTKQTTFRVNRPAVGTTATRNVVTIY